MRRYPDNSPKAAARILVVALLSDGHVCKRELQALDQLDVIKMLDLQPGELHTVLQEYCEDQMTGTHLSWVDICRPDLGTLAKILDEIVDPNLRIVVLRLCQVVVEADQLVTSEELAMLSNTARHWGLHLAPKSLTA